MDKIKDLIKKIKEVNKKAGYVKNMSFKKGHIPWNKGTKGIMKPNSGSFKKGEHRSLVTEFKVGMVSPRKGVKKLGWTNQTSFKKGQYFNESNPNWKGDDVGYHQLHRWLIKNYRWPTRCEKCGGEEKVQLSSKNYKYTRKKEDWWILCYWCHRKHDLDNGWGVATEKFPEIKRKVI